MGIGSLYYLSGATLLASLLCESVHCHQLAALPSSSVMVFATLSVTSKNFQLTEQAGPNTTPSTEPSIDQETLARRRSAKLKQKQTPSPRTFATNMTAKTDVANLDRHEMTTYEMKLRHHAALEDVKMLETPGASAADRSPIPRSHEADKVQSAASTQSTDRGTESSLLPTRTTYQKTSSSAHQPPEQQSHSILFMALNATPKSEHPKTSAFPTTNTPARQFETAILKPTTTSSARMTTSENSAQAMPPNLERSDSSAQQSAKVEKFETDQQVSCGIRKRSRPVAENDEADGSDETNARPQKRSKAASRIQIEYDDNGVPRLRVAQAASTIEGTQSPVAVTRPNPPSVSGMDLVPSKAQIPLPQDAPLVTSPSTTAAHPEALFTPPKQPFSLLGAIIEDSSLIMALVSCLDIPSLISWYAIDKKFHWYYNKNYTAFILASVRTWAPGAESIFPWRHYEEFCIKDPIKRQKTKADPLGPELAQMNLFSRDVPSMRWLQMVVWREGVVKDMTIQLAAKAFRTPPETRDAIKRLWFIMDLPLNAHRLACIQSKVYITDRTLHLATHFFIKVDMFFTDPAFKAYPANHPNQGIWPNRWAHGMAVGCNLREKLLAEKSLTPLWRVMRGWAPDGAGNGRPIQPLDILKLWMRHRFRFDSRTPEDIDRTLPIMGLRMEQFYKTGYQKFVMPKNGTPFKPIKILSPDLLVMGEAVRRRIDMARKWYDFMAWGFVGTRGRRIPTQTEEQQLKMVKSPWTPRERFIIARNKALEKKRLEDAAAEVQKDVEINEDDQTGSGSIIMEHET
ncbi:hypothetical protein Slin15195_G051270 [Septoria linicola]|uniref:Uncharacterized protein n=1 Tax=Septoria linicola TaxID=215465 RepID=A0A9Q9ATE7_9PEZI|nr:hypothetical protein Slin15195_G051270 [Septoria linicola]